MTWTPEQEAVRADWGLDELDADPDNFSLVDPAELAWRAKVARGELAYTGPSRVRLPSLLPRPPAPLSNAEIASHVARFVAAFPVERAMLALTDPGGEADAVEPFSEFRARQILLEQAENQIPHLPLVTVRGSHRRPDGRDLLTRLGADPNRGRGVIRRRLVAT